jgi:hypothetical protein
MDAAGTKEHTTAEPKYTSRRKYEHHTTGKPNLEHGNKSGR